MRKDAKNCETCISVHKDKGAPPPCTSETKDSEYLLPDGDKFRCRYHPPELCMISAPIIEAYGVANISRYHNDNSIVSITDLINTCIAFGIEGEWLELTLQVAADFEKPAKR